jgi:hypothetical protein
MPLYALAHSLPVEFKLYHYPVRLIWNHSAAAQASLEGPGGWPGRATGEAAFYAGGRMAGKHLDRQSRHRVSTPRSYCSQLPQGQRLPPRPVRAVDRQPDSAREWLQVVAGSAGLIDGLDHGDGALGWPCSQ